MALLINDECINCGVCEPECPNEAIFPGEEIYLIDPTKCTECLGHFDEPQCQLYCPIEECILIDEALNESEEILLERFKKINPNKT